ncbi:cytochrome-c peroxidase [Aurantibacillus circumpalustris]|uniref:cytochrome-c peroxidase n=1 Tax=Aurantibacillus circumpalustris TaxID=3036359 RepID=UPI00295AF735|nr:cytochrome c peroxidase [Aurantibacillus circumpalustris]
MNRKLKIIRAAAALFLIIVALPLLVAFKQQNSSKSLEEFCRTKVSGSINEILIQLKSAKTILETSKSIKSTKLVKSYSKARKAYKEIEFFIEYYSAFDAKFFINGPLVPKIELEISSEPFPPRGFQVIEEILFSDDKIDSEGLTKEYDLLIQKFEFLKEHYSTINIEENKLHDALQLQIVRIMCLTLNGYDCTINKESIKESAHAIAGMEAIMCFYKEKSTLTEPEENAYSRLTMAFKACRKELLKHPDSDTFDRLRFMIDFLNPLYIELQIFLKELQVKKSDLSYAVNFEVTSFFENESINRQCFSVYVHDSTALKEQAELGRLLFYDPVLSGNNKRACASCHNSSMAFTDAQDKSLSYNGSDKLTRNAPTLINAAYQKLFFHDGRQFNLEEQANSVFNNVHEMNTNEKEIVLKLKQSREYRELFSNAYKNTQDSSITAYSILKSLSEYIKTLESRSSKFDKYLRGTKTALTVEEKNGYNLFAGKALCGSCHFFPLFNGTVPPMFNDNEFEVIGTPERGDNKNIDPDRGRKHITGSSIHEHAFKTPSLRNIEYTAPYMHNGVYDNLDSVLVFYNRGGGVGLGLKVENQTLPFDSLGLSKKELNNIKSFLLTLSDTVGLTGKPNKLPRFENQRLNSRKIGGEY